LHVGDEVLDEMQVIFLARVDLAPQRRRQRMILVQHHRDFAVFGTEHNLNVQPDQRAQAFFRHVSAGSVDAPCVNAPHHVDDPIFRDLHGVRHDVKQNFVFRLEVVIKAALGKLERGGHIVHGRGIVSALLKKARSRAQNFLARFWPEFLTTFNGSFAQHHSDGIAECEPLLASGPVVRCIILFCHPGGHESSRWP